MLIVQRFGCMLVPFKQRPEGEKMSHLKKFFFIYFKQAYENTVSQFNKENQYKGELF